jgi:hypothetical protein
LGFQLSLHQVLRKFAEGFSVFGIFLQTQQEIFPIIQQRIDSLLVIKRHPNLAVGISKIDLEGREVGVLIDPLNEETNIVILSAFKNIQQVAAHWKRFLPVVQKQIQEEDVIKKESVETKLINRLEDIRIAISNVKGILKEKINSD